MHQLDGACREFVKFNAYHILVFLVRYVMFRKSIDKLHLMNSGFKEFAAESSRNPFGMPRTGMHCCKVCTLT